MRQFSLLFLGLSLLSGPALLAQRPAYGGKLKPEQANMDVKHYTIDITLDIPAKSLSGTAVVDAELKAPATTILLDLMDSMKVSKVWVNDKPATFTHDHHMLSITGNWMAGPTKIKVTYGGHPMIAKRPPWDDGFTFTTDSTGHPWVAVTAEGTGGKIYFPAKDHPSDEPDNGVDLTVAVPKGLVVAGPGLLQEVKHKGKWDAYHWKTRYPINNYSIVFNVGDYTVVNRTYTTIKGRTVPMQFYVLKEHADKGPHQLEMLEQAAHIKEKYFGEYPWANEKIGIVETPHLGMEHQTMNAYGNKFRYTKIGGYDFDGLMFHEFGHEWWGNKVTASDWADYWIHEGINTFADALFALDVEGEDSYNKIWQRTVFNIHNDKPVIMGKDIEEDQAYNHDIYPKGGFFIHTLRYVLGDSIFWPTIKGFITDSNYTYVNTTSTQALEDYFNKASGQNLDPLFHLYLYTTDLLEVEVKQKNATQYLIRLNNMPMTLPLDITTNNGTARTSVGKDWVTVSSTSMPLIDTKAFYLKKVTYE
jgi:aminopeptidase N